MGQFPEEHPQFINEIHFQKVDFSPFFDDFLHPLKMRIFRKKKNAPLESPFLLLSEGVIFFLVALSAVLVQGFKKARNRFFLASIKYLFAVTERK